MHLIMLNYEFKGELTQQIKKGLDTNSGQSELNSNLATWKKLIEKWTNDAPGDKTKKQSEKVQKQIEPGDATSVIGWSE